MNLSRSEFVKRLGLSVAGLSLAGAASQLLAADTETRPLGATTPPDNEKNARLVSSGPGFGNRLALTFDDGPTPGVTEKVLDALRTRKLRASFCMIGQKVAMYPDLARQVKAEGHEICNHTFTHPDLGKLPPSRVDWEIQQCQDAIGAALSMTPVWMRPPYGSLHKNQGYIPLSKGLGVCRWNVDPKDWSQPGVNKIVEVILGQARPGSIILCHDLHNQTAEAVDQILDGLLARDFEFINITGFVGLPYEIA